MHDVLDALAVNDENGCIVEHLSQASNIILFNLFAGVCELKLALGISFLTYFAKDNIRERSFGAYNHLRPQISNAFDNIAINEKRPKLRNIHEVVLSIFQDRTVLRVEYRVRIDQGNEPFLPDGLVDLVELNSQTKRYAD